MMTCDFRSFEEAWGGAHRWVWLDGSETPETDDTTREATRETSDISEGDKDPGGTDAAAAAQAAARELIARVQDPTHETYGQLNDRARQGLVATLTQMFNEETDEYKTRVAQFQTVYEEELKGNGQELARDLEAIVALAEGKAPAPATLTGPAVAPEGIRQHPNFKPAMAALDDVKFGIPEHDLPAGINVNDGSFRGAITSIGRFRGALGKFSQGTARNAFAEHVGMNPSLIIAGSKNTLKLTYNQDNGQVTAEIIDKTSPEAVAARATQAARRQAQRERAPAPAPAAAPETQISDYFLTVQRGDTMSAIIRNKLANNDMDPLRTQIARQYGLGDGFPTYAGGDTDGAQFMRLLMAKRHSDYYQNLIHPGNQVYFNENGEIAITKGDAKYAPGEKESVATGGTTRTESAPAGEPAAESAPAPERSQEKIATLEKNWTEIIEPKIREEAGQANISVVTVESGGANALEKTVTLTNTSGKTVKLIVKPPPISSEFGIYGADSSIAGRRFLVVDEGGNQTSYKQVFGSGNQLDFALNLLRTSGEPTVEAPAAPETRTLDELLPEIERKGRALLENVKSKMGKGESVSKEVSALNTLFKPLSGHSEEFIDLLTGWGFIINTSYDRSDSESLLASLPIDQGGHYLLEVFSYDPPLIYEYSESFWKDNHEETTAFVPQMASHIKTRMDQFGDDTMPDQSDKYSFEAFVQEDLNMFFEAISDPHVLQQYLDAMGMTATTTPGRSTGTLEMSLGEHFSLSYEPNLKKWTAYIQE